MWTFLLDLLATLFGRHKRDLTRPSESTVGKTKAEMIESEVPEVLKSDPQLTPHQEWVKQLEAVRELVLEEWDPPVHKLPSKASELRHVFGRAPKEKGNRKYPKAELRTYEFIGDWNNRARLYVHTLFEPYFRMWLKLLQLLRVLHWLKSVGSYNHRHIHHNKANPLSNHSWAIAIDVNTRRKFTYKPNQNRAIYRADEWRKKIRGRWVLCAATDQQSRKGPVPVPFTKEWLVVYDGGIPFEAVLAAKMIGLCWGGDWGRDQWVGQVLKHGVGYDPLALKGRDRHDYEEAEAEWKRVKYVDPMHIEAQSRRGHFVHKWMLEGGPVD